MINKFKDFLKSKLSRKKTSDLSDQDELLDDNEIIDDGESETEFQNSHPDQTGEHELPDLSQKLSFKEKIAAFREKINGKLSKTKAVREEEASGPLITDDSGKLSFKEKMALSLGALRAKISGSRSIKIPAKSGTGGGGGLPLTLSPSLTKSIEKVLSRESREPIHQISIVLIICAITYTVGKLTALGLRGAPALSTAKSYTVSIPMDKDFNPATLAQVRSINIFRTNTGMGSKKKSVADTKCDVAQQVSTLPIKLVNTIVLQDTVKSLASVQVKGDRDLEELREGDQIGNLAKIFHITRLEMLIKNLENGVCESVTSEKAKEAKSPISIMSPSAGKAYLKNKKITGIDNVGNKFTISKTLIDEKMKDIAAILTQAKAIQIQNPDGSLSFKMTEMDPAGIFPYLGIQDQDIITSINGKPIHNLNEVMSLFGRIKNLENLSLGIKREGSEAQQDYSIKQ